MAHNTFFGPVTLPDFERIDSEDDTIRDLLPHSPLSKPDISRIKHFIHRRTRADAADKLRLLWSFVFDGGNPYAKLWGLAFAAGMEITMDSDIGTKATELGITKSDLDKIINHAIEYFGLPRPRHCKSEASRAVFSKAQRSNHWRGRTAADLNLCKT